jgi:hypothetical protein
MPSVVTPGNAVKSQFNLTTLRCFHFRHCANITLRKCSHITANMEQDVCFVDKQTVANRCDYMPEKHRGW